MLTSYFISFGMVFSCFLLFLGNWLVLFFPDWFVQFVGLEMISIGVIFSLRNSKPQCSTSMMCYFLMSSMSGIGFFISSMMGYSTISVLVLTISLLIKLGSGPFFYMWMVYVCNSCLSYGAIFFVLSISKIGVLSIINSQVLLGNFSLVVMIWSCVSSVLIGGIGLFFSTDLRDSLSYSSVSHSGFILYMCGFCSSSVVWLYFLFYSIFVGLICLSLSFNKNQGIYKMVSFYFFAFSGVPPVFFFSLKFFMLSDSQIFVVSWVLWTMMIFFFLVFFFI